MSNTYYWPFSLSRPALIFVLLVFASLIIPVPGETVEEIDDILAERLPEEHMEESLAHHLLEFLGV